jgi:hypothetical protein
MFGSGGSTCLIKTALAVVICLSALTQSLSAGEYNGPSEAKLTDRDRICIALHCLADAINRPNDFNLDMVASLVPAESKDAVLDKLCKMAGKAQASGALSEKSSGPRILLQLDDVTESDGRLMAEVTAFCDAGQYTGHNEITLEFSTRAGIPTIENSDQVLNRLGRLAEQMSQIAAAGPEGKELSATAQSLQIEDYQSDNLLKPRVIFNGNNRFTKTVSQQELESVIFSRPYGIGAVVYDDPVEEFNSEFLFVTDANWDRIIASDNRQAGDKDPWIVAYGSHGTGTGGFCNPTGIASADCRWLVADAYNNRVQAYYLYGTTLNYLYTIEDNFDVAIDVAAARIPINDNPGSDITQIAVLDWGNGLIKLYSFYGTYDMTLFLPGSLEGRLNHPTSLCYKRSKVTNYPMSHVYVTDNGNKRVLSQRTTLDQGPFPRATPDGLFPEDAHLTSVSVDAFGYPYVVDQVNAKIYLLSLGLDEILATFGEPGTGPSQLHYPNRLQVGEKWTFDGANPRLRPDAIGDVFVTEHWGDHTGVRRFVLGLDILAHQTAYIPKRYAHLDDYVRCEWYQTGTSRTHRRVLRFEGFHFVLADSVTTLDFPGRNYHVYTIKESDAPYLYIVDIDVASVYPGSTDTTFRDTIAVSRHVDETCFDTTIHFVMKGLTVTDPTFERSGICVHFGENRWWQTYAGTVGHYDTARCGDLLFYWEGGPFYEDTLSALPSTKLVTTQRTVYFKLPFPPYFISTDTLLEIGQVMMTSIADTPFFGGFPFVDTAYASATVYADYCCTPCTTCTWDSSACPMLYAWNGRDYEFVDNILPMSEDSEDLWTEKTDLVPVFGIPSDDGTHRFLIREDENEISRFNTFELFAADVPGALSDVRLTSRQDLVLMMPFERSPTVAVTDRGRDVSDRLKGRDGELFVSGKPGFLDVEYRFDKDLPGVSLGLDDPSGIIILPPDKIAMEKPAAGGGGTFSPDNYTISAYNEDGGLDVVEKLYPRVNRGERLVDLSDYIIDGTVRVRLEWTKHVALDHLPFVRFRKLRPEVRKLPLVSAAHSSAGPVTDALRRMGGDRVTLGPGEQIELAFRAEPPPDGTSRVLLFKAKGRYERYDPASPSAVDSLPSGFTFEQNYPNPFNPMTTFSFSLPEATHVKLDIYNILGKRVVSVLNEQLPAGRHTCEWDGRDGQGRQVASGVYFARLRAGEFDSTKKMVVVK